MMSKEKMDVKKREKGSSLAPDGARQYSAGWKNLQLEKNSDLAKSVEGFVRTILASVHPRPFFKTTSMHSSYL